MLVRLSFRVSTNTSPATQAKLGLVKKEIQTRVLRSGGPSDGDGYSAVVPKRVKRRKHNSWPTQPAVPAGSRIKLCLFPELYSKPDRELTQDGARVAANSCLVECDNFVRDNGLDGLDGFTLVVKAVVWV
jgi:hypothetical protein